MDCTDLCLGCGNMGRRTHDENRLQRRRGRLIGIECLQWCANNAVYFLGLIGAATYDLAGTAFLVAAITLVRNLAASVGNFASGSVIDAIGPRKTTIIVCALTAVVSLAIGLAPITEISLMIAAFALGLSGGFLNTSTHAYPGYLVATLTGRQRLNGLMVLYSNIAFTLGPIFGGALVSTFSTQSVYLFMAAAMAAATVLAFGCHEELRPEHEEEAKTGVLSGMVDGARVTLRDHDLRLIFISGFLGFFAFGAFDSLESLFYRDVLESRCDVARLALLGRWVHRLHRRMVAHQAARPHGQSYLAAGIAARRGRGLDDLRRDRCPRHRDCRPGPQRPCLGLLGAVADDLGAGEGTHRVFGSHHGLCPLRSHERPSVLPLLAAPVARRGVWGAGRLVHRVVRHRPCRRGVLLHAASPRVPIEALG
ncbi:MAG: MFS transporter [Collinsella sp.]